MWYDENIVLIDRQIQEILCKIADLQQQDIVLQTQLDAISSIADVPDNSTICGRYRQPKQTSGTWVNLADIFVTDAPADGASYVRKDKEWVQIPSTSDIEAVAQTYSVETSENESADLKRSLESIQEQIQSLQQELAAIQLRSATNYYTFDYTMSGTKNCVGVQELYDLAKKGMQDVTCRKALQLDISYNSPATGLYVTQVISLEATQTVEAVLMNMSTTTQPLQQGLPGKGIALNSARLKFFDGKLIEIISDPKVPAQTSVYKVVCAAGISMMDSNNMSLLDIGILKNQAETAQLTVVASYY